VAGVSGDAQNPGLEAATPELADSPICGEKRILAGILGCLGVAHHPQGKVVNQALILLNQEVESLNIAFFTSRD
jgi:hypothetical protein